MLSWKLIKALQEDGIKVKDKYMEEGDYYAFVNGQWVNHTPMGPVEMDNHELSYLLLYPETFTIVEGDE